MLKSSRYYWESIRRAQNLTIQGSSSLSWPWQKHPVEYASHCPNITKLVTLSCINSFLPLIECRTEPIVQQSKAGLNTVFFLLNWLPKKGYKIQSAVQFINSWGLLNRWMHTFPEGISTMWNKNSLVLDLNLGRQIRTTRTVTLQANRTHPICPLSIHPVDWGRRIHWLLLCRGVRKNPSSPMSVPDMTLNTLMVRFQ